MNESMVNLILEKVIENGEQTAKVVAKLDEHTRLITESRNDIKTIVDKQNQDIEYFHIHKEEQDKKILEQDKRLKEVEDYVRLRQGRIKKFWDKISEASLYWLSKIGWVIIVGILMAIVGAEKAKDIINNLK